MSAIASESSLSEGVITAVRCGPDTLASIEAIAPPDRLNSYGNAFGPDGALYALPPEAERLLDNWALVDDIAGKKDVHETKKRPDETKLKHG